MAAKDQDDLFGYSMYGGSPPAQRHSDTSKAAAESIRQKIGPLHIEILNFLAGRAGATDEQMQAQIPMAANTQRPRRVELTQMGRVVDSTRRDLTRSRRQAVVWMLRPTTTRSGLE